MNKTRTKLSIVLAGFLLVTCPIDATAGQGQPALLALSETTSPRKAELKVKLSADNKLCFSVFYNGKPIIEESSLGMIVDNQQIGEHVQIKTVDATSGTTVYTLERTDGMIYYLDTRQYDDGVALRYRIPSATGTACVYGETTSFTFPSNTRTWYASGPFQYGWLQQYQERLTDSIQGELLAPPATFLTPDGTYAAITEANLFNYHGAVLLGDGPNRIRFGYVENKGHLETGIITGLPPAKYWHEEVRDVPWVASAKVGTNEIVTPWRILMLADDLNGLVNNQIMIDVSDKPDPELFPEGAQTSWIKPGRSVFTWLVEGGSERLSLATHRKYIDGASELGLESVVVDDGWELWATTEKEANGRTKWEMMKELVDYARKRNVDIWVWRSSSPRSGNRSDIGLVDPVEREQFMKKCAEIGVKGLKIDFFHTENAFTVNLMEDILKDAAKEKLMVIFHGVNKPTGDSFTYPNLLAKEAVRGQECVGGEDSWAPGPSWPYHTTVLPFTRWLAGPADYSPLNFRAFCHPSVTFAHQLSSIYMFTSPMLILAADMEDMLSSVGREFIEEVPVVWDETVVLPESKIGELAALARRKGDVWYLTVLNGEKESLFETAPSFLSKGKYKMTLATDAPDNRKKIVVNEFKIRPEKNIKVNLASGGGFIARFEKQD